MENLQKASIQITQKNSEDNKSVESKHYFEGIFQIKLIVTHKLKHNFVEIKYFIELKLYFNNTGYLIITITTESL